MNDIRLLKHNTLRNALYHEGRRRVLEGYNRFCTFIVIVLGASVVSERPHSCFNALPPLAHGASR